MSLYIEKPTANNITAHRKKSQNNCIEPILSMNVCDAFSLSIEAKSCFCSDSYRKIDDCLYPSQSGFAASAAVSFFRRNIWLDGCGFIFHTFSKIYIADLFFRRKYVIPSTDRVVSYLTQWSEDESTRPAGWYKCQTYFDLYMEHGHPLTQFDFFNLWLHK